MISERAGTAKCHPANPEGPGCKNIGELNDARCPPCPLERRKYEDED